MSHDAAPQSPVPEDASKPVRAVALARIPEGVPTPEDFRTVQLPRTELADGQLRVAVLDLSLDPYLRSTLGGRHLGDRMTQVGDVIGGRSVAQVVESRSGTHTAGDLVLVETGWRSEAVVDASAASTVAVPDGVPTSAALGVLGMPGLTAYAAHVRHTDPQPGETVVVSSATGGVGALAGQLARLAGARTVAIVGSDQKGRLAVDELGYDTYVLRGENLADDLREACPEKVDVYLHMGDQETLDVVMEQLAIGARVSLIGIMDQSNGAPPTRVRAGAVMAARAALHGMVVYDHTDLAAEHVERVGALLSDGTVSAFEDRTVGLERAGEAFSRMMAGLNVGKAVVEVSAPA